jgi:LAS superfamily LD-carboxypeptidase LdcB
MKRNILATLIFLLILHGLSGCGMVQEIENEALTVSTEESKKEKTIKISKKASEKTTKKFENTTSKITDDENNISSSVIKDKTTDVIEIFTDESIHSVIENISKDVILEPNKKTEENQVVTAVTSVPMVKPQETIVNSITSVLNPQTNVDNINNIEVIDGVTYVCGILIANKTYALPSTYYPGDLTQDVKQAFNLMQSDASAQGLSIWISSGFRSYNTQSSIYNSYVRRDGQSVADTYSARPGHSEHQTGLAFDLNSISDSFADTSEGKWVAENCHKYGFIIRYPKGKEHLTGYKYESWHLRYLGVEKATEVYNSGFCLEEYLGITSAYNY